MNKNAKKGWDNRDYRLWSRLEILPHFGILPNNDRMISLRAVREILEIEAEKRGEEKP